MFEVDLWEIDEAFAVVARAAFRDLRLTRDRVNIHGAMRGPPAPPSAFVKADDEYPGATQIAPGLRAL